MYRPKDEVIPGYALQKFLGRGGFGEVWQANAPGGVPVAVKVINLADDQGFKEFRAINLFRTLKHPNLVPLLSIWLKDDEGNTLDNSGADGGGVSLRSRATEMLIIMGLGDKSLRDRLKECRADGQQGIAPRELLRYMEDAAKALDYLNEPVHQLGREGLVGIQHCDIKPANILIVGRQAQVCDFGVARVLGDHVRSTTGAFAPAYVAPEMIDNKPCRQTDQYSLAISYVELRTGIAPVPTHDVTSAILAHKLGNLDLSNLLPGEQEIIRKATTVDPMRRFVTCEEMVDELKAACRAQASAGSSAGGSGTGVHLSSLPGGENPSDPMGRSGPHSASAAVASAVTAGVPVSETRVPGEESATDPFGTLKAGGGGPEDRPTAPSRSRPTVAPRQPDSKVKLGVAAGLIGIVLAVVGYFVFAKPGKDDDNKKGNGDVAKGPAAEIQKLIEGNDEESFRQAVPRLLEIADTEVRKKVQTDLEFRWISIAEKSPVEQRRKQLAEIDRTLGSDRARQLLAELDRTEWIGRVEQLISKGDIVALETAWEELGKHREDPDKETVQKLSDDVEQRWFDAVKTAEPDEKKRVPLLEQLARKTGSKKASEEIARIKGPDVLIKETLATLTKDTAPAEVDLDRAAKALDALTKHAVAGKRADEVRAVLADLKKNAVHVPKRDPDDLLTYVWLDLTAERLKDRKALEDGDRQSLALANRRLLEERLKQLDDLFRSTENKRSVYRASVLRAEVYRGKPSPTPADRTAAVASLQKARDVAFALQREGPPPELADEVLDTLFARLDEKALLGDSPDEPLRQAVGRLYADAGKLIAADLPAWSAVKKLGPPDKKILELYTTAHRLAPNAENLVLKVFAETDERSKDGKPFTEAEIDQLVKHAEEAVRTGPELEVGYNLRGYTLLLRSSRAADFKERQELLAQALKEFETADAKLKKKAGDTKDEQITHNIYRSIVSLTLAPAQIDKPAEQEATYRNALTFAEAASKLADRRRPDAFQTLAAAQEAVARSLGETDKFADAESNYTEVITRDISKTQIKPFVSRGRCRYLWALRLSGDERKEKLLAAGSDLDLVIKDGKGSLEAVEALQYRSLVARQPAGMGEARKGQLEKAAKDLNAALAIVQAPDKQNDDWKAAVMLDLGYVESELADLCPKDSEEQKQHLQKAAQYATDLKPISPVYAGVLLGQVRDKQGKHDEGWYQIFKQNGPSARLQDRHQLLDHYIQRARALLASAAKNLPDAAADAQAAIKLDVKDQTNPHLVAQAHGQLGFVKFQQGRAESEKTKRATLMADAAAEFLAAIRADESLKKRHNDAWLWRYLLARVKVDEMAGALPAAEVLKLVEEAEKTPPEQLGQTVAGYPAVGSAADVRREMARLRKELGK